MEQLLTVDEAVGQLVQIRDRHVNLGLVLNQFKPDHIHWKEEDWGFETRPDLYRWLFRQGLPHFLKEKLIPTASPKEASARLLEKYFKHFGVTGEIQVSGEGLLDYHTGVRINSRQEDSLWSPEGTVKLFPEVDFIVNFDYPEAPQELRQRIGQEALIQLNTNKVDGSKYKPSLVGFPQRPEGNLVFMTTGMGYLNRLNSWLQGMGLESGNKGLVVTPTSQKLIEVFTLATV